MYDFAVRDFRMTQCRSIARFPLHCGYIGRENKKPGARAGLVACLFSCGVGVA